MNLPILPITHKWHGGQDPKKLQLPLSKASHPAAELAKLATFSRREKMTGGIRGRRQDVSGYQGH
jgi:hypothetical protein